MGYETYMLRVIEYDWEIDGENCMPTDLRTLQYLARPFVVQAGSEEEAINIVTERTGWLIKHAEFMEFTNVD